MFLKLFILCAFSTIFISATPKAYPGKLKILPGLAFYRTDDDHDDGESKLTNNDKKLLQTVWKIVDKSDKTKGHSISTSKAQKSRVSNPTGPVSNPAFAGQGAQDVKNTQGIHDARSAKGAHDVRNTDGVHSLQSAHGAHGIPHSLPITTINVYPSYPGRTGGDFTSYHAQARHRPSAFGAIPFSASPMPPEASMNPDQTFDPTRSDYTRLLDEPNSPINPYDPNNEEMMKASKPSSNPFDLPEDEPQASRTKAYKGMMSGRENGYSLQSFDQDGNSASQYLDQMQEKDGSVRQARFDQEMPQSMNNEPESQYGRGMEGAGEPENRDMMGYDLPQGLANMPSLRRAMEDNMNDPGRDMGPDRYRDEMMYRSM